MPTTPEARRRYLQSPNGKAAHAAYQRRWSATAKGKVVANTVTVTYRQRHPEREAAHQAVSHAVRAGTLIPQPCWCGERGQAHHHLGYDVEHRLDVVWLCEPHHKQAHREVT